MLFIESRTADLNVEKSLRTPLLEALQERGHVPLIRSSRLHFFELALADAEQTKELETAVAKWSDAEGGEPYVRGDVFCSDDFAHFIVFGEEFDGGGAGLRAGIVCDSQAADPSAKLDAFCRDVREAFESASRGARAKTEVDVSQPVNVEWRARGVQTDDLLRRFASEGAGVEASSKAAEPRAGNAADRARAFEIIKDADARVFLQHLNEAQADGRVAELRAAGDAGRDALVSRLAGAGLVRREVQISCRKDGRSLFRLPSTDALAIVTASSAVCSECGTPIADERAEELVTPTPLASSMLRDGAWLMSSLRTVLDELGVPEGATAARSADSDGEGQLLATVCGEPFLFVLRDGDFTNAHARRALEGEAEAQASRLVVVATGRVQEDARARLREHARRRSRAGNESEVIFLEGLESAPAELRQAFERVSQDALARELYELDASAGLSVSRALAARFSLARQRGALQDLAASAAGALSASMSEI